ncbi:MAG: prolipoprotein diacylglyceryl transferase [Defluviitaleaceae bacterium]|nr:prolipoprotein diacylglyceryl transferase [Defluviitaleaceae bacterium]
MTPEYAPDIWFPHLGISFRNVPTVLFTVPFINVSIYMYAVCVVLGIVAAFGLGIWWVKRSGQKVDDYVDLMLLGVPLALVGLRTHYLIFSERVDSLAAFFSVFFSFREGGLAIYGGIIGAALAALIIGLRKKIPFTTIADTGAPCMLLGQVIGRFGNFFNREAFGGYTDGLFAMRIRVDQVSGSFLSPPPRHITAEMLENIVYAYGTEYFQVHPTFFYEAAFNFLLMVALLIYRPHKRFGGEIVLYYFLGYGIIRFFLESLRTDQMIFFNTGLPTNQIMAALFAVVSAALLIAGYIHASRTTRKGKK